MDPLLAAIDLGSNSFRLSIGRVEHTQGHPHVSALERHSESVRLAANMGADKRIHPDAIERAITILKRFHQSIAGLPPHCVRAVATNTFRVASNQTHMLELAEQALGIPIDVISGEEEARLIYAGISSQLPSSTSHRLMVDIGGGSTEIIIGQGDKPLLLHSLAMGCVSYTDRFFKDGWITADRFDQAIRAAKKELTALTPAYLQLGWQEAYGSSGTAKGLAAILQAKGYAQHGITVEGLHLLQKQLIHDQRVQAEKLPGIKPHRIPVLAAGLAIMTAIFEELSITLMQRGEGALRAGILYELAQIHS